MYRFIETICFEKGYYPLLHLHQQRLDRAFAVHFPGQKPHNLSEILPSLNVEEKHKLRVVYNVEGAEVECSKHLNRQVSRIRLVENDFIDYAHKYEDRSELQALFEQRGDADEIIIIKKGMVTDSFYANAVFWDGRKWYTPKTYLLDGVRRRHLLDTGKVEEMSISGNDIFSFEKVSLVNALNDLDEISVPVHLIK